jgi:hypothetical protein
MTHGTRYAYSNRGCRCLECVQFAARDRRRGLPENDPRHGKASSYSNYGCHCPDCRAANTRKMAERNARKASS